MIRWEKIVFDKAVIVAPKVSSKIEELYKND